MSGRQTLSGAIADAIVRQIRDGRLEAGHKLPTIKELAEQHGVGYGAAREAMQRLQALGLVDVRPRRGAVVRAVDPFELLDDARLVRLLSGQSVDELYDLRALVEVAIAGQAAERATPAQLAEIVRTQRVFDAAVKVGDVPHDADVSFHSAIAQASSNIVYGRVLGVLRPILSAVRAQAGTVPGASQVAQVQHAAITDRILARDPEGARREMESHIATAKETVRRAWNQ